MPGQTRRLLVVETSQNDSIDYATLLESSVHADSGGASNPSESGVHFQMRRLPAKFEIERTDSPEGAFDAVLQAEREGQSFDVMLVELGPPPGWGSLETLAHIWAENPMLEVLLSCCGAARDYTELYASLGDNDQVIFLSPPIDMALLSKLVTTLARKRQLEYSHENSQRHLSALSEALRNETEQRRLAEDRNAYGSSHDPLTGLPTLADFEGRIDRNRRNEAYGVAAIHLDAFEMATLGLDLPSADAGLDAIARKLQRALVPGEMLARGDGPEFWVHVPGSSHVLERIESFRRAAGGRVETPTGQLHLTATAGLRLVDSGEAQLGAHLALRDAKTALALAKDAGGNRCECFDQRLRQRALERLEIRRALGQAARTGDFELHYQPLLDLETQRIIGVEALLRWQHEELGAIAPEEFIPVAEASGLIVEIGHWVLDRALTELAELRREFSPDLSMAVNISALQLEHAGIVNDIQNLLERHGCPAGRLQLEIGEAVMLRDPRRVTDVLQRLRGLGVRVHLDDFGTGQASLAELHTLPIDAIKIDRSFIQDLAVDHHAQALVQMMKQLAQSIGVDCVAEGIETAEALAELSRTGCRLGQGFHFCRPLPAAQLRAYLSEATTHGQAPAANDEGPRQSGVA